MSYQNFLNDIADKYDLSGDEKETFKYVFDCKIKKHQYVLAQELSISDKELQSRLTIIYDKFKLELKEINSKGKFKALGYWLQKQYEESIQVSQSHAIDWQKVCRRRLTRQKEDRQLRKKATAIGAEVNVYVPLDLLEHKEQTRSKQDKGDSDQRNQYQEPKVVKTYAHKDFLDSLTDRQSKNKHIAIVGEAGAGKTTLLARIADELDKNQKLQIFVSLADLREQSLGEHIYGNWLSKALGVHKDSINAEQTNDLFQQFQSGEIWLLLDGLDEMRAKSSADALEKINREIREVIGQSRVVLTSRLNVWDAYLNRLSGFDTFRMGNFSPEQVDKFISDWFVAAKKPESASILQAKLKEPNRDRIRDMVRNPLRLALLCQAFYRDLNTELPETKAGLYDLFVRYFYEWKPNNVDVDLTQDTLREELHLALGKLAIAGIDGDAGFRLPRSLAVKEMGDRLFKLASDVGWLTLIERDEQDQEVYVFYHASFQEYFAALAVQALDSEYFLPTECDSNNFDSIKPKKYRVFCQEWKDVILFWIGRLDIENFMKEMFIYKLMLFQDNCGDFYRFRALCIATECLSECLSEFNQIKHADLLISWITSYAFIYDFNKYTRYLYNNNYTEEVKSILKKTKVKELMINLEKRMFQYADREESKSSTNSFYLEDFELAKILLFIDPNNQLAISKITDVLDNNKKYHFNVQDLEDLCQLYLLSSIKFNNIPEFLIDLLSEEKYKYIVKDILRILTLIINARNYHFLMVNIVEIARQKISDNDLDYIIDIVEFLRLSTNAKESEIDIINLIYTKFILELEDWLFRLNNEFEENKKKLFIIAECLIILDPFNLKAIDFFFDCFELPQDYISLEKICSNLIKTSKASENIKKYLFELLRFQTDEIYKFWIANILINVDPSEGNEAAKILVELLETNVTDQNSWIIEESAKLLVKHNLFSKSAIKSLEKLAQSGDYSAAYFLGCWSPKNFIAIDALLTVLDSEPKYAFMVSHNFKEIDLGEHKNNVIAKLEDIITLYEHDYFKDKIYEEYRKHSYGLDVSEISEIQEYIFDLPTIAKNILLIDSKNIIATSFLLRLIETLVAELTIDTENNSIEEDEPKSKAHKWYIQKKEHLLDYICKSIEESALCNQIIPRLKFLVQPNLKDKSYVAYRECHKILWHFAQKMSYPDFYEAWHSEPPSTHPEVADTIPSNNTNNIQTLESQLIDCDAIQKELDRNADHPEIRCLVVDIRQLEQESDPNVIAEEIAIKIFDSLGREIPEINRVSNLKRELLNLKRILRVEKLAIALYGKSANEAINQLCQSLTDSILIRPFTGEQTTQELITQINAWLSEM